MTSLQRLVQYIIILNFILNLFSFINIKPDLSHVFDELPLSEEACEICNFAEICKAVH